MSPREILNSLKLSTKPPLSRMAGALAYNGAYIDTSAVPFPEECKIIRAFEAKGFMVFRSLARGRRLSVSRL